MQKIAITALKGVGRRYVCVVITKADTRTGELWEDGVKHVIPLCRIQANITSQTGSSPGRRRRILLEAGQ